MEVPGGVYLCQVNETVSCGACCGLYNTADTSFETMQARLAARTDGFSRVRRDPPSIEAFALEVKRREPGERPLSGFHHCPFVGLIGAERSRVGCLLHPLAPGNGGRDYRGLSHYGGMACKICFCPAHRVLAPRHREVLRDTAPDWHAYGILITEARTLDRLFRAAEAAAGGRLAPEPLQRGPGIRQAVRALYDLVLRWPFRRPGFPLGTYFLGDGQLSKPSVDYAPAGGCGSRHDAALRELATSFRSSDELTSAEGLLEEALGGLAASMRDKRLEAARG